MAKRLVADDTMHQVSRYSKRRECDRRMRDEAMECSVVAVAPMIIENGPAENESWQQRLTMDKCALLR